MANRARALICEAEDEIQKAIEATCDIANDEKKEAVLALPIAVRWNMDTNKVEVTVGVNVRHKFTSEASLPDPDQPELLDREGDPLPELIAKPMRKVAAAVSGGGGVSFKQAAEFVRAVKGELNKDGGAE